MARLADLLRCTEGQAYTLVIGIVVAVTAAGLGLPPTFREPPFPSAAAAGSESSQSPSAPGSEPGAPVTVDAPSSSSSVAGTTEGSAADGRNAPAEPPPTSPPADTSAGPGVDPESAVPAAVTGFGAVRLAAIVGDPGAPEGVGVDEDGRVLVATNNALLRGGEGPSQVLRYDDRGRLEHAMEVTGQAAARGNGLTGLEELPDGLVLALDAGGARVLLIDVDAGRQETLAELPDLPACALVVAADVCEPGPNDDAPLPRGLAVGPDGVAYIADAGQGLIWRLTANGEMKPFHRFEDGDPVGVASETDGDLVVVLSRSVATSSVVRIPVMSGGSAGDPVIVAELDPLSGPVGVAVAPGGGLVIALTQANELVLLASDGSELDRLSAADVENEAGLPLDGPTGVTVHEGAVFVTNQSPVLDNADHWVVFAVRLTA